MKLCHGPIQYFDQFQNVKLPVQYQYLIALLVIVIQPTWHCKCEEAQNVQTDINVFSKHLNMWSVNEI